MIHLKKYLLVFSVVLLSCGVTWAADVYTWVDEDGVVHYTDTAPGDASEWEEAGDAASSDQQYENVDSDSPAIDPEAITDLLRELKKINDETEDDEEGNAPSVELYTTNWCTYCKKAKAFFRSKGIAFTEYNIEKDKAAAQRMASLTESRAVPFVIINGKMIQGYSIGAYERALRN